MVSSPACSRAATWSAASRGLPAYISWVESFTLPTVTEPLSRSQGRAGRSAAEAGQYFRTGELTEQAPGHEQLGAAYAGADHRGLDREAGLVDQDPPTGGEADRRDPAVLHPRLLDGAVHRQEGGLADVEGALDQAVHVGARVGADDAGRHPLLACAPAHHDDAVGAPLHGYVVRLRHRRGVGQCRVDLDDRYLGGAGPVTQRVEDRRSQEVGVGEHRERVERAQTW